MISPKNILILRWARLGDIVLTEPAVRQARTFFPQAKISYLVDKRFAPVVEMMSSVDEVLPLDRIGLRDGSKFISIYRILRFSNVLRRRKFDLLVDLHSFRESGLLALWSAARWRVALKRQGRAYWRFCFNLPPVREDKSVLVADMFRRVVLSLNESADQPLSQNPSGEKQLIQKLSQPPEEVIPRLVVAEPAQTEAQYFLKTAELDNVSMLYGFQLSAGAPSHVWPLDCFISLARKVHDDALLRRHSVGFIGFCGSEDQRTAEEFVERMRTDGIRAHGAVALPLQTLSALMKRCAALISNDTGPMHLGAAVGTPTLGLFGRYSYPQEYRPLGPRCSYLQTDDLPHLSPGDVYSELRSMLG